MKRAIGLYVPSLYDFPFEVLLLAPTPTPPTPLIIYNSSSCTCIHYTYINSTTYNHPLLVSCRLLHGTARLKELTRSLTSCQIGNGQLIMHTPVCMCACVWNVERAQKLGLFQQDHSVKRICIHCVYIYSYVNKTYHRNDREKKRERAEEQREKEKLHPSTPIPPKRSFIFTASPPPKRAID